MTPIWFALLTFELRLMEDERYMTWLKRIGNSWVYIGCLSVSLSPIWSATIWPFIAYSVGNIIWLYVAWRWLKDRPLVEMNLFFLAMNTFAIYARA